MFGSDSSSRRSFLRDAGAAAVASSIPWVLPAQPVKPHLIDIHHHFEPSGKNKDGNAWTIQMSLDQLDANEVTTAIAYAGPLLAPYLEASHQALRKQARETNEWSTKHCDANPGRFGLFASLPMNDVEGSLLELTYALDVLKADGVGISTQYGEAWLGDPKFDPIFEELNRRKAVVYVHPSEAPCCTPQSLTYEKDPLSTAWIEFPMNTARTIMSLWVAQTTRRLPAIRFIFCHGGGVMPQLLGRIAGFDEWRGVGAEKLQQLFPNGVYAEYAKFYFDCAQAFAPEDFDLLQKVVPSSHLLFGSDYGYFPESHSVRLFKMLPLSSTLRQAVSSGNAGGLLPRWRI